MPRFSIVGQKFKNLDPYLPGVNAGTPALLVREPNNPHDAFAVAVYIDGKPVGYIGKRDNVEIAKRIDAEGVPFRNGMFLALDSNAPDAVKAMRATFCRSPNSSYPQIEVEP